MDTRLTDTQPNLETYQARRSELGKQMGLNVGQPNEMVTINGREMEARDDVGILLSTDLYAKRSCRHCYGRGHVTTVQPVPTSTALKLIAQNPANEALLHQSEPGKYSARSERMCDCAKRRYKQKHALFVQALLKEGLAKPTGIRTDDDGYRRMTVELL